MAYLEGRCVSWQAIPYGPLCDLLRHACGCTEADSPTTITAHMQQHLQTLSMAPAEAVPFLLPLLGMPDDAAPLVGRSPQELRTQTFATLHQLLLQASQRQPLLVVVENLHWDRSHLPGLSDRAGRAAGQRAAVAARDLPSGLSAAVDGEILCDPARPVAAQS